jgi:GPH family glycoside/pentoside/hexuronide:cation symporter
MFFGALPFAFFLFLLFIPPKGLSELGLFVWFVTFATLTRTAQTFFQIPYLSLGAELTTDYVERSSIYSFGQFFGFLGNVSTAGAGYLVFFRSTEIYKNGMLNGEMYPFFGAYVAILILIGSYLSVFGIYQTTKNLGLKNIPQGIRTNLYDDFRLILKNKSFFNVLMGAVLLMVVNSTGESLSAYLFIHFWGFRPEEIAIYLAAPFALGLVVAMWLAPRLTRRLEKRNTLIISNIALWTVGSLVICVKLFNWIPLENEKEMLFLVLIGVFFVNIFAPLIFIMINSVFADVSDEVEYELKQSKTGTLFAIRALLSKIATGVGSLLAGLLLQLIHFPKGVEMGELPKNIVFNLGLITGPFLAVIGFIPVLFFLKYKLTKKRHEEILNAL